MSPRLGKALRRALTKRVLPSPDAVTGGRGPRDGHSDGSRAHAEPPHSDRRPDSGRRPRHCPPSTRARTVPDATVETVSQSTCSLPRAVTSPRCARAPQQSAGARRGYGAFRTSGRRRPPGAETSPTEANGLPRVTPCHASYRPALCVKGRWHQDLGSQTHCGYVPPKGVQDLSLGGPGWGGGGRQSASRYGQSFPSTQPPETGILAGLKFSALSTQGCSRPAVWRSGDLPVLTGHPAPPRWARARLPHAPAPPAPACPRILPFRAHLSGSVPGTHGGEAQGAMSTSQTRRRGPGSRRRRSSLALSPTVRGLGTRARGPRPVASICAGDQSPLSSRRAISSRPEGFTSGFFTIPASPLRSSGTQEVVHTLNQTDSVQHRLTDNGPRGPGRPRKPHDLRPSGRA